MAIDRRGWQGLHVEDSDRCESELAFHKGKVKIQCSKPPFESGLTTRSFISQKSIQLRPAQVEGELVAKRKEILHRIGRKRCFIEENLSLDFTCSMNVALYSTPKVLSLETRSRTPRRRGVVVIDPRPMFPENHIEYI